MAKFLVLLGVFGWWGLIAAKAQVVLPPIKIGASLTLSGTGSSLGKTELGAILLAIEDINKSGGVAGRNLELVPEDNQGEAKVAIATVNKLLREDRVDLLFTAFTHIVEAVQPVLTKFNVPTLYHASTPTPARSSPHIFKDYGDAPDSGRATAAKIFADGHRTAHLISMHSDACLLANEAFEGEFINLGGHITKVSYFNAGESDFRPYLLRIRNEKDTALLFCAYLNAFQLMRQLDELQLVGHPIYLFYAPLIPASDTPEVRKLYERSGSISTWYGFRQETASPEQLELVRRFSERFAEEPTLPDLVWAYDGIQAFAKSIKQCVTEEHVDHDCAAENFSRVQYEGIGGMLRFNENGLTHRPVIFIEVKDGKWRKVEGARK
jgi:ABC-type branched-subunit amino acid transport system substrate-binding protein